MKENDFMTLMVEYAMTDGRVPETYKLKAGK